MMRELCRGMLLGCLGLMVAGCGGGSGSTGLITSETAVIDDVRRTGTCGEFDGAPYCATDSANATAPGGQSASVVSSGGPPTPAASPTPGPSATAAGATATPLPSSAPTIGGSATPGGATATPVVGRTSTPAGVPTATPTPASLPSATATPAFASSVTIAVTGFEAGAACATAARAAGSEDPWRTATLVAVDGSGAAVTYPLPTGVAAPFDLTLLCFADPPSVLPPVLMTLTDANPTVVFVLPSS
jgi:hypothetical protein